MTNLKTIPILVTHACERLSSLGIFGKHESVEISNRKRENGLVQNVRFDGGNIKAPTAQEGQKHQPLFLLQVEARVTTSFRDDLVAAWNMFGQVLKRTFRSALNLPLKNTSRFELFQLILSTHPETWNERD